jgi:uncharacterized membrane protein
MQKDGLQVHLDLILMQKDIQLKHQEVLHTQKAFKHAHLAISVMLKVTALEQLEVELMPKALLHLQMEQ